MRPPTGDRLDDALDMWHNDSWDCPGGKVHASTEQIAHVLKMLRDWYHDEFFPRRIPVVPKERERKQPNARVDRGSQKLGRDLVYGRSGGWCEIAAPDICSGRASEWHHRLNKGQGGRWDASNGLHLCNACHDYVTNREREEAKAKGWAVAPGVTPPIEVPVLRRGVLVYLDDEGGLDPVKKKGGLMAEELVELTAAIQHELELARSGDGYEEAAVAEEIVERLVAPMLASWEQRLGDVREEYRKSLESWDRSRVRLDGDRALLLWLHAEAVWKASSFEAQIAEFGSAMDEADRVETENNALRREVSRLRREARFEALGGVDLGEGGYSRDNLRFPLCSCLTAEQVAAMDLTRWSLPQCSVHPDGGTE